MSKGLSAIARNQRVGGSETVVRPLDFQLELSGNRAPVRMAGAAITLVPINSTDGVIHLEACPTQSAIVARLISDFSRARITEEGNRDHLGWVQRRTTAAGRVERSARALDAATCRPGRAARCRSGA